MKKSRVLFSVSMIILAAFAYANAAFAYTSPGKPTGLVNDFAQLLTPEQRSALEAEVGNFARPAGLQMAVAIVPSLGGETIESYAVQLFKEWGIGDKMKDNGVLLLVAPSEREVRIEVGYGLEPYLTDAESSYIIRTVIMPAFKSGDYYGGMSAAVTAMEKAINADPSEQPPAETSRSLAVPPEVIFFVAFVLLRLMVTTKSWWLGGIVGGVAGLIIYQTLLAIGIGLVLGLVLDFILSKIFAGKIGPGGRGPLMFFGGGVGGGRSGGGFGGFGGGMSGGGGASGRW